MGRVQATLLIAAMCVGTWLSTGTAHAFTTINGTSGIDQIVVGNYFAVFAARPMVCINGTFTALGPIGGSLDDDYIIDGLGAADTMQVIRSTTTSSGSCAAGAGATWLALSYGTHWLDLDGNSGNDVVQGGNGDTHAVGGANDDVVTQWNAAGRAYGGSGDDDLFGEAGTGDWLSGEGDSDCLQSTVSSGWATFNCGTTGTDNDIAAPENTGTTDCESEASSCGPG